MTTTRLPRRTAEKCNSTTIHKNNQVVKNKLFIMIIRYTSSTFLCLQKAQSLRHILRYGPIIAISLCFSYFFFCFLSSVHLKSQSKINWYHRAHRQDFMGGGHKRLRKHSTFKHHGTCLETEPESGEAVLLDQEV